MFSSQRHVCVFFSVVYPVMPFSSSGIPTRPSFDFQKLCHNSGRGWSILTKTRACYPRTQNNRSTDRESEHAEMGTSSRTSSRHGIGCGGAAFTCLPLPDRRLLQCFAVYAAIHFFYAEDNCDDHKTGKKNYTPKQLAPCNVNGEC